MKAGVGSAFLIRLSKNRPGPVRPLVGGAADEEACSANTKHASSDAASRPIRRRPMPRAGTSVHGAGVEASETGIANRGKGEDFERVFGVSTAPCRESLRPPKQPRGSG